MRHAMPKLLAMALSILFIHTYGLGSALPFQDPGKTEKPPQYEKVGDNERVYNAPFDTMWMACVHAANQNFTVEIKDKDKGAIEMRTGVSLASNKFHLSVKLEKMEGNKTRLKVNTTKNGKFLSFRHKERITEMYFKGVDDSLNPKM